MIRTSQRATISAAAAADLVEEAYGVRGALTPLPGERDANFLLEEAGGRKLVVKVSSPDEPDATLRFEARLLAWLGGQGDAAPAVPTPLPSLDGALVARCARAGPSSGAPPLRVRLAPHLPGRTLASVRPRGRAHLEAVGEATARLTARLAAYPESPPPRRDFVWALSEAGRVMQVGVEQHPRGGRRTLVEGCLQGFLDVEAALSALPLQVNHGDLNDHNLLVGDDARVTGVLDFGDAHAAPAVCDLAIAVAYAVLGHEDPVHAAGSIVAGYHRVRALSEEELALVFPLARARLGASVSIAATRREAAGLDGDPDPYLLVSEVPAWNALELTHTVHPRFAEGVLRHACGLPPCRRAPSLSAWLAEQRPAPVMDVPLDRTTVLDLSVASPLLSGRDTDDTAAFTRRVWDAMEEAGADVGIGRYMEPRGFYLTDAFAGRSSEVPERRTVHLGIDVFAPAGAEVRSPLAGTVFSVHDNAARLDYGPTVILEHGAPDGSFWTLFGHLERASVAGLAVGDPVAAGEAIARVGPPPENGDWPPHLHFQILADLVGNEHDFPGVAEPRDVGVWAGFCPDPNLLLRLPMDATWREPVGVAQRRARLLGPSLTLSYRDPIHVVRGRGAHLYDVWGRAYLDCVNNVAHVGHEHPRVVAAGQRQMAVLNTNTRYLHETVLEYADRLAALFPPPLSVCFFVNSGSEANELALRMARAATGGTGVVVLEGGYHGHTQGLVEVSHYKFAGAGGGGAPPWVRVAPLPDTYRGRYRRGDDDPAGRYATHVADGLASLLGVGIRPAALLGESILSCGGQVEPPEGYWPAAYTHARAAGALCIADEVQVGFGRVGSALWGFGLQGVVPDIVTLGKPMGNGHPLGAVVTTPEIAAAFANGMEFFSTFGGNPVSAAVGLAVLDVLRDEGLQAHALEVGEGLKAGLAALMGRHSQVGDVRGRGLFLGVEMVKQDEAPTGGRDSAPAPRPGPSPNRRAARYVVERMKEKGILLSTDGPDDNVLKIKPPLPFSRTDAERLVEALDRVLGEDGARA